MDEIIIRVARGFDESGWLYDIYDGETAFVDGTSEDGGKCTTTAANALDMAVAQAKRLLPPEAEDESEGEEDWEEEQ
jgi:hypothetical protein